MDEDDVYTDANLTRDFEENEEDEGCGTPCGYPMTAGCSGCAHLEDCMEEQ